MAAVSYSAVRDLFELTHNQFTSRYGLDPNKFGSTEFQRLRAYAGSSPHSTLISCGTIQADTTDVTTSLMIVTRVYAKASAVSGTPSASVTFVGSSTSNAVTLSLAAGGRSELSISNVEMSLNKITLLADANCNLHYEIYGYTPSL